MNCHLKVEDFVFSKLQVTPEKGGKAKSFTCAPISMATVTTLFSAQCAWLLSKLSRVDETAANKSVGFLFSSQRLYMILISLTMSFVPFVLTSLNLFYLCSL